MREFNIQGRHQLPISLLPAAYMNFMQIICLFVCFVALRPKSTAMVMVGRSVHLTTLFSWASLNKYFVHIPLLVTDNNPS